MIRESFDRGEILCHNQKSGEKSADLQMENRITMIKDNFELINRNLDGKKYIRLTSNRIHELANIVGGTYLESENVLTISVLNTERFNELYRKLYDYSSGILQA